ncbi:hypothetical protein EI77_02578 [Prosthecobacter fusiformis]|uniref:Uncharacterized protein n=1 Tax=Prosthecobacter fusiformis TaxID=48464 RepID=A0A4R7RZR6_9BACT|nr:DUF883 C-terminal domain-containing protein [Prosthecobacter fusiformis]TDU71452.1 hypothetical protein EI77_02578 [Prosthecobacter fusiformis]
MNENPSSIDPVSSAQQILDDVKKFAHEDPTKAAAAAFGVGLLITMLPARAILGSAAFLGATFLRPTLLTLGLVKGLELCCKNNRTPSNPS